MGSAVPLSVDCSSRCGTGVGPSVVLVYLRLVVVDGPRRNCVVSGGQVGALRTGGCGSRVSMGVASSGVGQLVRPAFLVAGCGCGVGGPGMVLRLGRVRSSDRGGRGGAVLVVVLVLLRPSVSNRCGGCPSFGVVRRVTCNSGGGCARVCTVCGEALCCTGF